MPSHRAPSSPTDSRFGSSQHHVSMQLPLGPSPAAPAPPPVTGYSHILESQCLLRHQTHVASVLRPLRKEPLETVEETRGKLFQILSDLNLLLRRRSPLPLPQSHLERRGSRGCWREGTRKTKTLLRQHSTLCIVASLDCHPSIMVYICILQRKCHILRYLRFIDSQ